MRQESGVLPACSFASIFISSFANAQSCPRRIHAAARFYIGSGGSGSRRGRCLLAPGPRALPMNTTLHFLHPGFVLPAAEFLQRLRPSRRLSQLLFGRSAHAARSPHEERPEAHEHEQCLHSESTRGAMPRLERHELADV